MATESYGDVAAGIGGLDQLERESNVTGLIQQLESPVGEDRRWSSVAGQAALALGRLGDRRASPQLVRLVGHDSDTIRFDAVWALGRAGDEAAIPVLIMALDDSSKTVRMAAAQSLGLLRAESARDDLRAAAETSDDAWVRLYAAEAVAAMGDDVSELARIAASNESSWRRSGRSRKKRWRRLVADEPG